MTNSWQDSEATLLHGTSLDECFVVLETTSPQHLYTSGMHQWNLIHIKNGSVNLLYTGEGTVKSLWVSPTNTVYLTAPHDNFIGLCCGSPTPSGYVWNWEESLNTPSTYPESVWGISDELVVAWGGGILQANQYPNPVTRPRIDEPYCWIKRHSRWTRYPSPGWLSGMHGYDEDTLYAIGHAGLTARWCGTHWEQLQSADPSLYREQVIFVQVTPEDVVYGTSNFGDLLNYSKTSGWKRFIPNVGYITGFVYWKEALYLLKESGLHKIEGRRLTLIQEAPRPKQLVAGTGLLWLDEMGIHEWTPSGMRSIAAEKLYAAIQP